MKIMFLIVSMLGVLNFSSNNNLENQADLKAISEQVKAFASFADKSDVKAMSSLLHDGYRSIVNQAFGSPEVTFMDKDTYLDLLKKGVIGGSKRILEILSIDIIDKNAVVKVQLSGQEMIFTSFIQLVKINDGSWKIMSDLPIIEKV